MSGDNNLMPKFCKGCDNRLEPNYVYTWCFKCKQMYEDLFYGLSCQTMTGISRCPNNAVEGGRYCEYHG